METQGPTKKNSKKGTQSADKNAQKKLPRKRKLSVNNSEEKTDSNMSKKQKTFKRNGSKREEISVDEKCSDDPVAEIKTAGEESARKSNNSNTKQTTGSGKAGKSTSEKHNADSLKQDSSDEQLPLSEISKRSKITKKMPTVESKATGILSLKGKPVEGSVKILKNVKDTKTSGSNASVRSLKKTNDTCSPLKTKTKSSGLPKGLADFGQTPDNADTESKYSFERKGKTPSSSKRKTIVTDFEEGSDSAKSRREDLELKTRPLKDENSKKSATKQETGGQRHSCLKKASEEVTKISKSNVQHFEDSGEDGDDSEMDWEDVAEASGVFDEEHDEGDMNDLPSTSGNVEFTIAVPGKKSKCGRPSQEEIRKWIQRKINKVKKEAQISAHKVHFLSLLAIGLKKNELCNNPLVQAVGLSLLPDVFTQRNLLKTWDVAFLTRVTTWVKNKAPAPGEIHTGNSEATYLMRVLEKKVYLFIAILRALGLCVRLVTSLQVLSHKVSNVNGGTKPESKQKKTPGKSKQTKKPSETPKQTGKKETTTTPKESLLTKLKRKTSSTKSHSPSSRRDLRKKAKIDYKQETESEYFSEEKNVKEEEFSPSALSNMSDDEDDFLLPVKTPKRGRTSSGESRPVAMLVDAPAAGEPSGMIKKGRDVWLEVYVDKEKKWISIDGDLCSVNQPEECEQLATKPIKYVMAFDNDCSIKDVTCRYASGWLTTTPKLRIDPDWLRETLNFYRTKNVRRDKKEDSLLKARLLQKPLPQTVSEYKNHPLYVLKRHLLKFEAIYPDSAATLGLCRGEAVYSRECVHNLHTREIWLKEAKVVKTGEQPYKIVKGRKSRRKMLENVGEVKAELFGRWQTKEYVPPPVVDGKVPRNEYGNVELFKPSMLPAGACHIQVPGIHRLARKLKIDAVPAVVGFDFHGGFNHPIIDGVVVGEEFKEELLLAWDKEQQEKIEREQARREKRVLENWAHLVRSLRIRERLKVKYKMEDKDAPKSKVEDKNPHETENVTDISLSWPLNKQEGKTARDDDGHCHVFLPDNHVQDPVTGDWSKACACGYMEPLDT